MKRAFNSGKQWLSSRGLWDVFTYVFFGGLTTLINIVVFSLAMWMGMSWWVANFVSWVIAVLFAFVTNKLWVFNSHTENAKELLWEFSKFIFARLLSLGIDYGFMYVFISLLNMGDLLSKILTQFVIVAANYVFSKFIIFKS